MVKGFSSAMAAIEKTRHRTVSTTSSFFMKYSSFF
jgi:hypothetical protein